MFYNIVHFSHEVLEKGITSSAYPVLMWEQSFTITTYAVVPALKNMVNEIMENTMLLGNFI